MIKKRYLLLVAVLGFVVVAVMFLPAKLLALTVAELTGGKVQIIAPSGTVWRGSGYLQLTGGKGSDDAKILADKIHWRLSSKLYMPAQQGFAPNLLLTIEQNCCLNVPLKISVAPGWQEHDVYIDKFNWLAPADLLSGLGAPWNTFKFQGSVVVNSKPWQIKMVGNKPQLSSEGITVVLNDLQTAISTVKPLGSYSIELKPLAGAVGFNLTVKTLKGVLSVTGNGQVTDKALRFKGELMAQKAYAQQLSTLLTMLKSNRGPIQFSIRNDQQGDNNEE